jgi:hypothetical protein
VLAHLGRKANDQGKRAAIQEVAGMAQEENGELTYAWNSAFRLARPLENT